MTVEQPEIVQGSWRTMSLQNFRLFTETGTIRIAPITLIFGKNSSGKTTLLRAPLLFRQLLSAQSATGEAPLAGPTVDFGSFKDVVRDGDRRRDVELVFRLNMRDNRFARQVLEEIPSVKAILETVDVRVVLHWNKRSGQAQIQSLGFLDSSQNPVFELVRNGPESVRATASGTGISVLLKPVPEISLRALDLLPFEPRGPRVEGRALAYLGYVASDALQQAFRSLQYIPPIRDMPERAYRLDQASSASSLSARTIAAMSRNQAAVEWAGAGLRRMEIARDVRLAKSAPGFVNIVLGAQETGLPINLADMGFGVSQVLPLLVSIATAPRGTTVLVEQPELHLHPQAQAVLADVLIDAALERGLVLVLETHSEHMFLRVRRRVADRTLPADSLAAYAVDKGQVTEIRVSQKGQLQTDGLPDGFFEDEWAEAVGLARAIAHHQG